MNVQYMGARALTITAANAIYDMLNLMILICHPMNMQIDEQMILFHTVNSQNHTCFTW
jgi:hypothetical protein